MRARRIGIQATGESTRQIGGRVRANAAFPGHIRLAPSAQCLMPAGRRESAHGALSDEDQAVGPRSPRCERVPRPCALESGRRRVRPSARRRRSRRGGRGRHAPPARGHQRKRSSRRLTEKTMARKARAPRREASGHRERRGRGKARASAEQMRWSRYVKAATPSRGAGLGVANFHSAVGQRVARVQPFPPPGRGQFAGRASSRGSRPRAQCGRRAEAEDQGEDRRHRARAQASAPVARLDRRGRRTENTLPCTGRSASHRPGEASRSRNEERPRRCRETAGDAPVHM